MKPGDLLALLDVAVQRLPELIADRAGWSSMDVDYEPPRVERLYRAIDDAPFFGARVSLHRIHPCDEALYHPHPWPSAILIVNGRYEMGVGYGKEKQHLRRPRA